jgi:hypothetical protein
VITSTIFNIMALTQTTAGRYPGEQLQKFCASGSRCTVVKVALTGLLLANSASFVACSGVNCLQLTCIWSRAVFNSACLAWSLRKAITLPLILLVSICMASSAASAATRSSADAAPPFLFHQWNFLNQHVHSWTYSPKQQIATAATDQYPQYSHQSNDAINRDIAISDGMMLYADRQEIAAKIMGIIAGMLVVLFAFRFCRPPKQ